MRIGMKKISWKNGLLRGKRGNKIADKIGVIL